MVCPCHPQGKYPGVLKTLFVRTRSIFQIAKKNLDEKYYFIMENHFPKDFEIGIFDFLGFTSDLQWRFGISLLNQPAVGLVRKFQNAIVNPR